MIGTTLSHYTILEELGRGGMGIVYRAEDTILGRVVALKVLPPHVGTEEDRARFRREAQAAAALNHPNIATIHDFGETPDGQAYLVMELVEGESLADRIERGPLGASEASGLVAQIARGLQTAHSKGIVHRDVKPSNMMLTEGDHLKILDFGLAKMAGGVDLTKSGSTVGTMAYMSPEQVQNGAVDHRTDLWSLGIVLYEMLTGERPFRGAYEASVIYGIVNEDVRLEDDRIPENLRPVLAGLLQKDSELRPASASSVVEALTVGSTKEWVTSGSFVQVAATPHTIRVPRWLLPAAAVGVIGGLALVWALWGGASVEPVVGVMYVTNATNQERLGEQVSVLVHEYLKVAGVQPFMRSVLGSVEPASADSIARSRGITHMVVGSLLQSGTGVALDVELVDVQSGRVVSSAMAIIGQGNQNVFDAVNRVGWKMLTDWGAVGAVDSTAVRLQDRLTSSYSAMEIYELGLDAAEHWRFNEAMRFFRQAIDLDSTSFPAYFEAIKVSSLFAEDPTENLEEPRRLLLAASRHMEHATPKEREVIEVFTRYLSFDEADDIVTRIHDLADRYGDDEFLQELASNFGSPEEGVYYTNRLFDLVPTYAEAHNIQAYSQLEAGNWDAAVSAATRYRNRLPNEFNSMDSAWEVLTGAGRFDEAMEMLREAKIRRPDLSFISRNAVYTRAVADDTSGLAALLDSVYSYPLEKPWYWRHYRPEFVESNVRLALGQWEAAVPLAEERLRYIQDVGLSWALPRAFRELGAVLHAVGRHEDAEAALREAVGSSWALYDSTFNPWPVLAAYQNGLGYADVADREGLSAALRDLDAALELPGMDARHAAYRHLLQAHEAILEGDADRAQRRLESMHPDYRWISHHFRLAGHAAGMTGDMDAASHNFTMASRFIAGRIRSMSAYPSFFIDHARVPFDIAQMYEARGDVSEARTHYRRALETWESVGADFALVELASERLAALSDRS